MNIVVLKGAFNESYSNIYTCIAFNIQDTVIYVEENG